MTLQPYTPENLDLFSLRLLDIAAKLRTMANICRDEQVEDFALHDKKASEWCSNLERWAHKVQAELEMLVFDARAARRVREAARPS